VQVTTTPAVGPPTHPDSSGFVDLTVPEGAYTVQIVPTLTPVPRLSAGEGAGAAATSLPSDRLPPPEATAFVVASQVTDIGVLYLADPFAPTGAAAACAADADCGKGGVCTNRQCSVSGALPAAPASIPVCGTCVFDSTGCGTTGLICVSSSGLGPDVCLPDCTTAVAFTTCTPDGNAACCATPQGTVSCNGILP
jgi:hypothetical protein